MHRPSAQRAYDPMAGETSASDPHRAADLLTRYGELAAELEDASDPAREQQLHALLDELDRSITRLRRTAQHRHTDPD